MTPDQAHQTVVTAFRDFWGSETQIAWDDEDFNAKGLPEYVRFSWQPQQGSQASLGPNALHRHEGVFFLQIFTERGDGLATKRNRDLQGKALEFLERFDQAVTFWNAGVRYIGRSGAWTQFNVSANFYYDSQRAA